MPANFEPLIAEVAELTTVVDSAAAFMDGSDERLAAAIAADNLSDDSNVAKFAADFRAQKDKLADAIARNTMAENEPPAGGETGGGTEG